MKLKNGRISILFDENGLGIDIYDRDAVITFARIKLNRKQTCQALSRLSYTECDIDVGELDKVGKKMELDYIYFEMPKVEWRKKVETACKLAKRYCPIGWEPDLYFSSQDSFYYKDGQECAKCTIRRWVDAD